MTSATDYLTQYKNALEKLKEEREALQARLSEIESILGSRGNPVGNGHAISSRKRRPEPVAPPVAKLAAKTFAAVPNKEVLKELIQGSGSNSMSRLALNRAGYSLRSVLEIAQAHPEEFGSEQNRAQGKVWLLQ